MRYRIVEVCTKGKVEYRVDKKTLLMGWIPYWGSFFEDRSTFANVTDAINFISLLKLDHNYEKVILEYEF